MDSLLELDRAQTRIREIVRLDYSAIAWRVELTVGLWLEGFFTIPTRPRRHECSIKLSIGKVGELMRTGHLEAAIKADQNRIAGSIVNALIARHKITSTEAMRRLNYPTATGCVTDPGELAIARSKGRIRDA